MARVPLQLTRVARVLIGLILLAASCAVRGADSGPEVLKRLSEAARKNRLAAEKFLFSEEITRTRLDKRGETLLNRRTYEVSFLEGENYYRLTGLNGEPLQVDDAMAEQERFLQAEAYRKKTPIEQRRKIAAKQERNRLKFDLETLYQTHRATVVGADELKGRAVTVVDIEPDGKPKRPRNGNQWGRILGGRLWIDDATGYPVRAEVKQLIEWEAHPAGNKTTFEWIRLEDAWLISLIKNVEPLPGGATMITSQAYSSYSRFQAESKLIFSGPP